MITRIITGIVLIAATAFFAVVGGLPLKAAVFFLAVVGLLEYYRAFSKPIKPIHYIGLLFTVLYMAFIDYKSAANPLLITVILFVASLLILLVANHDTISIEDIAISVFGFCYIPLLISTIWLVRESQYGYYLVWLIFIAAWGSDTGAYCVGKLFGKTPLSPKLSPNKTKEGSFGGVLVSALLCLGFGFWVSSQLSLEVSQSKMIAGCLVMGIVGAILGQLGDLAASTIKRHTGIKDFGRIFPGHGGVMDRFDSILFTAPAVYILSIIFDLY